MKRKYWIFVCLSKGRPKIIFSTRVFFQIPHNPTCPKNPSTNLTYISKKNFNNKITWKTVSRKNFKEEKTISRKIKKKKEDPPKFQNRKKKSVTSTDFIPLRFFWYWLEKKPTLSMDKSTFLRINKSQESISDYFSKTLKKNIFFMYIFLL